MSKLFLIFSWAIILSLKANCQTVSSADSLSIQPNASKDSSEWVYSKVDVEAQFPGGQNEWLKHILHLDMTMFTKAGAPPGTYRVVVRFVVSKKGKLSDFYPETNNGYKMEDEVIRILKNGPKWKPAQYNGHPVNSYKQRSVTLITE